MKNIRNSPFAVGKLHQDQGTKKIVQWKKKKGLDQKTIV
jgi:hypothetical protein